jgi:hypothetical protein
MLKFLQYMLNNYDRTKASAFVYDEDGHIMDAKVGKMTDAELMIPADKARILHSKSKEEVELKARKKIFQAIHREIKRVKRTCVKRRIK